MQGIFRDEALFGTPTPTIPSSPVPEPKVFDALVCAPTTKWVPKLRTGFFYNGDRQHYLFDKKASAFLAELTWTRIRLADIVIPGTETVKIKGIEIDAIHYRFEGPFIEINHASLDQNGTHIEDLHLDVSAADPYQFGVQFGPDDFLEITGSFQEVVTGTSTFTLKTLNQTIALALGERFYRFPVIPLETAPVIITDDSMQSWDRRQISPEFVIDYETGDLTFNAHQNLVYNGDFAAGLDFWTTSGLVTIETDDLAFPELLRKPYAGLNMVKLTEVASTTASILQTMPIEESEAYYLSFQIRSNSIATFSVALDILDVSQSSVGTTSITGLTTVTNDDWTIFERTIGRANAIRTPAIDIPAGAVTVKVTITLSNNSAHIDAFQLVRSRFPVEFFDAHPLSTVEYEVGVGSRYTHNRLLTYNRHGKIRANHFPLEEVDFNSLRHANVSGFLYFVEDDEVPDFQLGLGGAVFDSGTGEVSFVKGRRHLRYAKTHGPGKLNQVGILGLQNPTWDEEITFAAIAPTPFLVTIESPHNTIVLETATTTAAAALQFDKFLEPTVMPNVKRGNIVVRPGAPDEFILSFVDIDTANGLLILSQAVSEDLISGTSITIETRKTIVPNGESIKVISVVEDAYQNPLGQVTVDISASTEPADTEIEFNITKTNPDGQFVVTIVADIGASGTGILSVKANGIEDLLEYEVV